MLAPFVRRNRKAPPGATRQQLTMRMHLASQGGKQSSQTRPVSPRLCVELPRLGRMLCCRVNRLRYLQEAADASSGVIGGKLSLKEISTAVRCTTPLLFF